MRTFITITAMLMLGGCGLATIISATITGLRAAENEPKVITLSCDGTVTDTSSSQIPIDRQPKPIEKMGVVANLNERTVSFMGWVAPISGVDTASINFNGEPNGPIAGYTQRIDGILDRVTGHMTADTMTHSTKRPPDPHDIILIRDHIDVLCKATNRVF